MKGIDELNEISAPAGLVGEPPRSFALVQCPEFPRHSFGRLKVAPMAINRYKQIKHENRNQAITN